MKKALHPTDQDLADMRRIADHLSTINASMPKEISEAHKHSSNRDEILRSKECACFYCYYHFAPSEVEWVSINNELATCPRCSVDSVLGDASGFRLDDPFLELMHQYWF